MIRILLCAYNGAAYIEAQLRSILEQTEQNFELLVSDDGSTDGTEEIVRSLMQQYPGKLAYVRQPLPNGGACRHFLKLMTEHFWEKPLTECASAPVDYVMFADQDDVWLPEKIARTLQKMRALEAVYQKETPLLVHCDAEVVDETLRTIAPSFTAYQRMTQSRKAFHQLLVQNNVTGGAMMINRSLAARIHTMPAHAVMHDQWIALVAAAFGEIRYLDAALYKYRQHGSNVLGADKGSRVREVCNRLGIGRSDGKCKTEVDEAARSVYFDLFLQAESFRDIYGADLKPAQQKKLHAFLALQNKGRLAKSFCILANGLTYNKLHRTVGECLFMP